MKCLKFKDFWNAWAIDLTMILAKQFLVFFGSFSSFGSKLIFQPHVYEKDIFWIHGHFLIIFINNKLTFLPNMLFFALKKSRQKIIYCHNQLLKMVKMQKKILCWKNCALSMFSSFIKKNLVPHNSLHQKNRPKNTHFLMQQFLFHLKFCSQT